MRQQKTISAKVDEYVAQRRRLGYDLRVTARELHRFASYADSVGHHGPLTTELALRWARLAADCTTLYQARRIEMIRPFAKYLAAFEPGTQIPSRGLLGPAHRRTQPHIYAPQEVIQLMDAAAKLSPSGGLRPITYRTLLGLLASTGLRVCEALNHPRLEVGGFCACRLKPTGAFGPLLHKTLPVAMASTPMAPFKNACLQSAPSRNPIPQQAH